MSTLTREQMSRLRARRNGPVVDAERNGETGWCPTANAEVLMPPNGVCAWCSTDHSFKSRLTNRQIETMRLLAHGKTRKQIAYELEVSETTVANDWRDIRHRLGARTTTQAAVMLVREGSV